MLKGLGNDIIEIERIRKSIKEYGQRFLDMVFTLNEQKYCLKYNDNASRFAGRFSAKEAIVKVFGTGLGEKISFLDIEILNDISGKPYVNFSEKVNRLFSNPSVFVSISHCRNYATAVAIRL